jgi:glycosyltransferase involved in cell wall biosynthesis
MKVIQIISTLETGGAEKLILESIPRYVEAGIEMDLLVLWNNNSPFLNTLRSLNCCNIYILNESNNRSAIYALSNILKIRQHLRRYDLAHVHLFPPIYFVALANILNGKKIPLLFTEHSTTNSRIEKPYFKQLERFMYNQYNLVAYLTEEMRTIYENYLGKMPAKVIINNGVDIDSYLSAQPLSWKEILPGHSDSDKIIVQISAFRKEKDHKTVVDALDHLNSNYKVVFVGAGETQGNVKNYVAKKGYQERVYFLGQRLDVPKILKAADFIVLSSFYEGLSLSSIEGMASGKPFFATNVKGLSKIVEGAGVLFELENAKDLASKILVLAQDSKRYLETGNKGQVRAKEYGISKMINAYIEAYKSLVKE